MQLLNWIDKISCKLGHYFKVAVMISVYKIFKEKPDKLCSFTLSDPIFLLKTKWSKDSTGFQMWNVPKTLFLINCCVVWCFKVIIPFLLRLFFYMYLKISKIFMPIKKILGSRTVFGIQIFTKIFVWIHTNTNNVWGRCKHSQTHTHMHA